MIRIPNVDGFIVMENGIVSTRDVSCFMEIHSESYGGLWICVNVVDSDGFVIGEYTWYETKELLSAVIGG